MELADDAAYVNWGVNWRMPSDAQLEELKMNCTWAWTTQNGVDGRLVTGPNGNSIFLPAAGFRGGGKLYDAGYNVDFWSRTLDTNNPSKARYMHFYSSHINTDSYDRSYGLSIRPVRVSQ